MYQFQPPLEISDFSGGITDNYIDCRLNQCQKCDNLLITNNKKLISRDGIVVYNNVHTNNHKIPSEQRIGALINHPSGQLFEQAAENIYYISGSDTDFSTLLGPVNSNVPLPGTTTTNFISQAIWRNHVYITSDAFSDPVKIFKDTNGTHQLRTVGLPPVDLEGALDLAVEIRTKYAEHLADTTEHTASADSTNTITSAAPYDLNSLITFIAEFITDYTAHETDSSLTSSWVYHAGQRTATHALASSTAPTNLEDCLTFLDDMKSKFNAHDSDGSAHGTDTQHQVSVSRSPSITSGAGAQSFIYGFFYKYTYTVGDITFENNGPVTLVQVGSLDSGTKTIANLPSISNGSTRNYDTANITLEIYRTTNGGTVLYFLTSLPNGSTSYSDATADSTIDDNAVIYTTGGVVDDDPPPQAKYISIVNDHACYANIKEGSVEFPTRFRLSRPGSPDACPADFEDDVEESITGVNNIGIYHILFTRNRVYRLEGLFDDLGRGNVDKREISREHGSICNNSIVKIPNGIVFAGTDGFYYTDGYSVNPISKHLTRSYANLVSTSTQESRIYGRYDRKENRVKWFMSASSTSTDNDIAYVLDLNFSNLTNPVGDGGVFTTLSNNNSWRVSSAEFVDNVGWVLGDATGFLFKFDSGALDDLVVDSTSDAIQQTNPDKSTIIWDYKSFTTTFGSSTLFKFTPTVTLQAQNYGNVTISIQSNNEDSNDYRELKEIRIRNGLTWGESGILWGAEDYPWNVSTLVRALRRFPFSSLRSVYKQIRITNSYTIIYNSDTYGVGDTTAPGSTGVLELDSGECPEDSVGYYLSLEGDSYTKQYLITNIAGDDDRFVVADPDNDFPVGNNTKWLVSGYRKKERLNLISFSINYATVQQNQPVYRGETGGNA